MPFVSLCSLWFFNTLLMHNFGSDRKQNCPQIVTLRQDFGRLNPACAMSLQFTLHSLFVGRATPTLHQDVPGLRCSGLKRDISNSSAASASTGLPAASSSGCSKSFQPRMPVLSETTLV